jgi:uncharacterized protein YkwD
MLFASKINTPVILLLLSVLLSSCPAPAPPDVSTLKERPRPRIRIPELEKKIHMLINRERTRSGVSALAWDDKLAGIAQRHSRDMSLRNYFSHDSPEGRDLSDRYRQAGYSCAVRQGNVIHTGAENIALNNLYDRVTTVSGKKYFDWNSVERIAETTVEGWMQSSGHRKNILTPHWRREGIGVFIGPDDKVYITQNFC